MEDVSALLLGAGALLVSLTSLLGIVELATIRTIRPPKQRTFSHIRHAATQYQTIFAPALAALVSGLFVSLSASFFYASLTSEQDSWHQAAGPVAFIGGMVALAATLWSALKSVGEPAELARDPFTIRAAADESAANPRHRALDPDFLTQQLDDWAKHISTHSLNLSAKASSPRLDQSLNRAAQEHGFWLPVLYSLDIYRAALLEFPVRFSGPLLSFALFAGGTVCFAVDFAGPESTTSSRPWAATALFMTVGAALTVFYCTTRGNRARLWHRIHLVALDDARQAIDRARAAHESVASEDALLRRVLGSADGFLQQKQGAPETDTRVIFRLGRFRVSIDADSSQGTFA
ncbi:hypothetical protein [Sanguibacter sp. 25GB23B1]|uniref:hypothetical protein n=1 Tax=unclassified Sanguibacter TaxID=2645534 RepID=UPI0032AF17A5